MTLQDYLNNEKSFDEEGYTLPPTELRESLRRYAIDHLRTGGFLQSVLEGDLYGCMRKADGRNRTIIWIIVMYIQYVLPELSYGSKELVAMWLSPLGKSEEYQNKEETQDE